ncbi:signal transducer and activator of transcription B-like [Homarus americanus]|uniref:signal transducer and activator of transcription B-like n=1 Tax=Homarus americanus TaxID=6706 RepID=UPI001C458D21|nr:signal transducer and activator of transcription B-like [Homarus americanus]
MGWCELVLLQTVVIGYSWGAMLVQFDSTPPSVFTWSDDSVMTVNPQQAHDLLASMVVDTARELHERHPANRNNSSNRNSHNSDSCSRALNRNFNQTVDSQHNTAQVSENDTSLPTDKSDSSVSEGHSHPWQYSDLQRETKKAVYRKLLTRTLQHHRQAYHRLREIVAAEGFKDTIIHQWLMFTTGRNAVLRILHSLKDDKDSEGRSLPSSRSKSSVEIPPQSESPNTQTDSESTVSPATQATQDTRFGLPRVAREVKEPSRHNTILSLLMGMVKEDLNTFSPSRTERRRRSQGGMMYLPVGGTTQVQCPTAADAAGVSITQMAFLTICLTVFNIIVNINNNINNNNNNNNINSDNNLSNNNAQLSLNVNNAAQVNVMLPPPNPGRKRRSFVRNIWREARPSTTIISLNHILQQVKQERKLKQKESQKHSRRNTWRQSIMPTDSNVSLDTFLQQRQQERKRKLQQETIGPLNKNRTAEVFSEVVGVSGEELQKGDSVPKLPQQRAEVAVGFMKVVKEWMKNSPQVSPSCRGLLLCGSLKHPHTPLDTWLNVFVSFVTHQRVTGAATSLHHFVRSAVTGQGCRHLFPECKQTLVS